MEEKQIISWIFLSISAATQHGPSDYAGISMIADVINHAVPTHKELQSSISYLMERGLVEKVGSKYSLSTKGRAIVAIASDSTTTYLKAWRRLEGLV